MEAGRPLFDPDHERFRAMLRDAVGGLDLHPTEPEREPIARRRRRRGIGGGREGVIQFVEQDGLIVLREGRSIAAGGRRRGRRRRGGAGGQVIEEVPFDRLDRSGIKTALERLDLKLTRSFGPREIRLILENGDVSRVEYQDLSQVSRTGRILLFVHGTFSNVENLIDGLLRQPHGRAFLTNFASKYDQVVAFNHRTLGVGPMLNARELQRSFRGSSASVDVICHSRGGLVTRCWLESMDAADPATRRVVFVGSPLAGTGLAAPPRLRATLNQLANVGHALGRVSSLASAAIPFLSIATALFRIFSSVTSLVAKTPVVDAALALVPGLDAMSRVSNNRLLQSFRREPVDPTGRYFVVRSNFESEAPGWRFWRYFRKVPTRLANLVADPLFDGPNDLVVDTSSMDDFSDEPDQIRVPHQQICDFGTSSTVHHMNYFSQAETLDFIEKHLKV